MNHNTMYAWAQPIKPTDVPIASNIDHTWVSTFETKVDPNAQPDSPPGEQPEHFWYCWGVGHNVASHALGHKVGNIAAANCISPSNTHPHAPGSDYSAISGSIEYYSLDGVCQTVANQILTATGNDFDEPMRVKQAKGYPLTTFFFGTYGLNDKLWKDICRRCIPNVRLPGDDFLPFMYEFVTDTEKQRKLLDIRAEARRRMADIRAKVVEEDYPYLDDVAEGNGKALMEALELLGWDVFKKLFPFTDPLDKSWLMKPTDLALGAA